MQLGCGGAYGTGGLFPIDSPSTAPLAFTCRVRGGSALSGGSSICVIAPLGLFPVPIPFGNCARLRVNPAGWLLFYGPAANVNGQSIIPIAPFLPVLGLPSGAKFPAQAALFTVSTGIVLSNTQWTEPL